MPILKADHLVKAYGSDESQLLALDNVSLEVEAGEFVAIMGPSGSGKSSLLTMLGGVENPTSGQVFIENQSLFELSDDQRTQLRRRRIGFIFQAFNLLPNLTARENVALPLELDGMSAREACDIANDSLDVVELTSRAHHRPAAMSGGEQQRVAIARALAIRPALLLADEPTGNLDSRQSGRISNLLQSLVSEQGQTIVMVTHDAGVAACASRLILIRDGRIESDQQQSPARESEQQAGRV